MSKVTGERELTIGLSDTKYKNPSSSHWPLCPLSEPSHKIKVKF